MNRRDLLKAALGAIGAVVGMRALPPLPTAVSVVAPGVSEYWSRDGVNYWATTHYDAPSNRVWLYRFADEKWIPYNATTNMWEV